MKYKPMKNKENQLKFLLIQVINLPTLSYVYTL